MDILFNSDSSIYKLFPINKQLSISVGSEDQFPLNFFDEEFHEFSKANSITSEKADLSINIGNLEVKRDNSTIALPMNQAISENDSNLVYFPKEDIAVKNLGLENIELFMGKSYLRRIHIFHHVIIDDLIRLSLIQKGLSIIHGACVAKNGKAIILPGWRHFGKTNLALYLVSDGYDLVSDDTVILSPKGEVFSFPGRIHLRHYNITDLYKNKIGNTPKFRNLKLRDIMSKIPYIRRQFSKQYHLPLKSLIPTGKRTQKAKVTHLMLLRGHLKTKVEVLNSERERIEDRLRVMNSFEFPTGWIKSVLATYSFFNKTSSILEEPQKIGYDNMIQGLSKARLIESIIPVGPLTNNTYKDIALLVDNFLTS